MPRIEVMIVGAQKAGTSSLFAYLGEHPALVPNLPPEFPWFNRDDEYAQGFEWARKLYFPRAPKDAVLIAKHSLLMQRSHRIERLYRHNPSCQIVVLLREPVARAYSAYLWARMSGFERAATFEEALAASVSAYRQPAHREMCNYLENGQYAESVERLWAVFPKSSVHVLFTTELIADAVGACQTIFSAAGVDDAFAPSTGERHNDAAAARSVHLARLIVGDGQIKRVAGVLPLPLRRRIRRRLGAMNRRRFAPPPIAPETGARLREHYMPHNERLRALLGRELPW